jgi:hypothetical protein
VSDGPSLLSDEPLSLDTLSDDKLNELLAVGGLIRPCPACGSRAWRLNPTRQPNVPPHFPVQKLRVDLGPDYQRAPEAKEPPDLNLPVTILMCDVCGFIRQHERQIFIRLLEVLRQRLRERAIEQLARGDNE